MTDVLSPLSVASINDLLARYCTGREDWMRGGTIWATEHASLAINEDHSPEILGIWSVRVPDEFRGQGYGRKLMEVICAYSDAVQIPLALDVYTDNAVAIHLYLSMGFEITHTVARSFHQMVRPCGGGRS